MQLQRDRRGDGKAANIGIAQILIIAIVGAELEAGRAVGARRVDPRGRGVGGAQAGLELRVVGDARGCAPGRACRAGSVSASGGGASSPGSWPIGGAVARLRHVERRLRVGQRRDRGGALRDELRDVGLGRLAELEARLRLGDLMIEQRDVGLGDVDRLLVVEQLGIGADDVGDELRLAVADSSARRPRHRPARRGSRRGRALPSRSAATPRPWRCRPLP